MKEIQSRQAQTSLVLAAVLTGLVVTPNTVLWAADQTFPSNIYVGDNVILDGTNHWILHTPDDGRNSLYVAPGFPSQSGWNWGGAVRFDNDGSLRAGTLRSAQAGVILKQDGPTFGWDDQSYILNWGWDSTYGDHTDLGWGGSGTVTAPLRISEVQGVVTFGQTLLALDGGNVGIGTSDPGTYKLAVNGAIKAKEVIVETSGWSDYVFADEYRLAPLSEVEAHIKAEKRLPTRATERGRSAHQVGEAPARHSFRATGR